MSFRLGIRPIHVDAPRQSRFLLCDVTHVRADAVTVDALARLVVAARRHGYGLRLCNASPQLCELIDFMGLAGALYSAYRYEQDRKSQSKTDRARAAYFHKTYFYRNGHKYVRKTVYKDGQKYYRFVRD